MEKIILIVEDDIAFGTMLQKWFTKNNFNTLYSSTIESAKKELSTKHIDLILSDLRLPDGDGVMLLNWMKEEGINTPMILMTGYGEVSTAVSAIKLGAEDFLEKPIVPQMLKEKIDKILNKPTSGSQEEGKTKIKAKSKAEQSSAPIESMVMGCSSAAKKMFEYINKVAPTNLTVLVFGESGTGKEYTANLIHRLSKRKDKEFIAIDCGSLSKELAPSELFGHVKGSFTSAISNKTGAFELANGGTIFLDEIGNLSYDVQVQILRAIQEQKIRPVGGSKDITVDVRIIAATNDNLLKSIEQGRFREDLYHRLNEFSLTVPPLRERKEDIELFANRFLEVAGQELNKEIKGISAKALELLKQYKWSGNVRELRNVIRRACLFAQEDVLTENDFPDINIQVEQLPETNSTSEDYSLRPGNEKEQIEKVLYKARGNKSLAAQLLKIDRKTLYNKMHLYGIEL